MTAPPHGSPFWHITLPMLRPVLAVTTVINLVYALRVFDIVYVLTNGGPGYATQTVYTIIFSQLGLGQYGIATAFSSVFLIVMLALSFVGHPGHTPARGGPDMRPFRAIGPCHDQPPGGEWCGAHRAGADLHRRRQLIENSVCRCGYVPLAPAATRSGATSPRSTPRPVCCRPSSTASCIHSDPPPSPSC